MFALHTPCLWLRDLREEDRPLIRNLAREPAVTRFQSWLQLDTEEAISRWVRDALFHNSQRPRAAYNLAIGEKGQEEGIGWIGWGHSSDPTHGEYSFGYALLPHYWGRGYMTEALRAGLAFMFDALGAKGITDYCDITNVGSMRVMEKAGMTAVARWQEERAPGVITEYVRYAIRRESWNRQRC